MTEACDFWLSSTVAADHDVDTPAGGSLLRTSTPGESELTTVSGRAPADDVGLHRQGRNAVAPPDQGIFLAVFEGRKLTERNRSPARQWHLHGAQGQRARRAVHPSRVR